MLPDNPMEIPEYAELWHDAKSDWDIAFKTNIKKYYQIVLDKLKSQEDEKTD